MVTLTPDQLANLKKEFIEFKINEMSYDENLYEILEDYVTDTVGSYTALQEFIHDRHAMEWIDD